MNDHLTKHLALAAFLWVAACGGDDTTPPTQHDDTTTTTTTGGQSGASGTDSGSSAGGALNVDSSSSPDLGVTPPKEASVTNQGDGHAPDAGDLITDPSAEDVAGTSWAKIGGCGTYQQSSTLFHTGMHSAEVTGRTGAFCGVSNGSLPLVDGSYNVSAWGRWEAGATGLSTLNLRLSARIDCANPASQKFLTIVNSVPAAPGTWVALNGPLTVETAINDGGNVASCGMDGQTLSHIYIFLEQVDTTAFPDLYMDDLTAESR